MYGQSDLKVERHPQLDTGRIECPVRTCPCQVQKARRGEPLNDPRFLCSTHGIYISPSTWEYVEESDNILWDYPLLQQHYVSKRESRISRDNSEDAVTWNVFRYLERNGLLGDWMRASSDGNHNHVEACFWSHSRKTGKPWGPLLDARREFGERPGRGSEPDLILQSNRLLCFIEAKLTSGNKTSPTRKGVRKKYEIGGNDWFAKVFTSDSDYVEVAESQRRYELMRLWLLGSWLADRMGLDFSLVNLVRQEAEEDIESSFGSLIQQTPERRFVRMTWENVATFISSRISTGDDREQMLAYFREKTLGYGSDGRLRLAFAS